MAQGKKTKSEIKKKIQKAKIENPEKSNSEIGRENGVSHHTVKTTLDEIPELLQSSPKSQEEMLNSIDEIVSNVTAIASASTIEFAKKYKKLSSREIKDLTDIAKQNFERGQILRGRPTEIKDINIKDIEGQPLSELLKIIDSSIKK